MFRHLILLLFMTYSSLLFSQAKEQAFITFGGFQVQGTKSYSAVTDGGDKDVERYFSYGFRLLGGFYFKERVGLAMAVGHRHYLSPGRSVLYGAGQVRYNLERDIESNYISVSLGYNFRNETNLFGGGFLELGLGFPFELGPFRASIEPIANFSATYLDPAQKKSISFQDVGIMFSIYF